MQTPEGNIDSVQRTVRGVDTGPTELADLLPGSTYGDILPGSQPDIASIRSVISESANGLSAIQDNTLGQIRNELADARRDAELITANVQGYIGNELDAAQKVSDKLTGKVAARIANGLTQAYAGAVQLGFPVPTLEQVQYGNATGDYLGSVFPPTAEETSGSDYTPVEPPSGDIQDRPSTRPPRLPIERPTQPGIGILPPPVRVAPIIPQPPTVPGVPGVPGQVGPIPQLGHYSPPPGYQDQHLWCDGTRDRFMPAADVVAMAIAAGYTYPIVPTIEYPVDLSNSSPDYRPNPIHGTWIIPDYAGNCPIGLVSNAGTGTFQPICIPPVCFGTQPPTQPPPQPPTVPPQPPTIIETCPAPTTPTCGEAATFPKAPDPKPSDDYCRSMEDWLNSAIVNVPNIEHLFKTRFNGIGDSTIAKAVAKAITGSDQPVIASIIESLGKWLGEAAKSVVFSANCDKLQLTPIAGLNGIIKFINQWFNIVPRAATQTLQQAENLVCQTVMPDQQSTDSARLADTISEHLWKCWTELNGSVVEAAEVGVQTRRTRPTSEQLAKLFRRDQISKDEFDKRIRQNGVIRDEDKKAIYDLTQDWPSLSDLTPMLVRDVWDETTIDWTEVDKLFDAKYTEETKKYFDAIGLTRDVVKYYWRAHFHLPSFTMASEMYHRFRNLPEGDPLRTDLAKVKALLIQDDWHPDWIDRMLAITFRPMRLIDIRTAYDMRIIDDEGLKDKLRILGYSDADVDITLAQWQRRRDIRDAKQGGFPSVQKLITQYANCEIDDHTFRYQLSFVVESEQQEQKAVEAAEIARQSESNRRTIAGVSWQYRRGLITEDEASAQLAQQGIDPTCIPSLVRVWKSQAAKQPKQLTAASLCKMLEQGIISQGDFVTALIRIGYTAIDAQRIVQSCSIGLTQKEMRQANREANRLTRERKAADREAARLQRLAECGPPPCPKNRQIGSQNGAVGP